MFSATKMAERTVKAEIKKKNNQETKYKGRNEYN